MKTKFTSIAASVLAMSVVATLPGLAQDPNQPAPPSNSAPAPSGGWRKFQPPADQAPPDQGTPDTSADPSASPAPLPAPAPPDQQGPAPSPYASPNAPQGPPPQ